MCNALGPEIMRQISVTCHSPKKMDLLWFILSCSLVCLSYNENSTHGSGDAFSLHSQLVLARVALNSAARHGSPLTRGTVDARHATDRSFARLASKFSCLINTFYAGSFPDVYVWSSTQRLGCKLGKLPVDDTEKRRKICTWKQF